MEPTSYILLVIVGFLLGIFSTIIGGALLILAPLLTFMGLPIHSALATGKISVVVRDIIPILKFEKKHLVDHKLVIPLIIAGALFSFIGTNIVIGLSEDIVKTIVAVFMVIISLIILLNPEAGLKRKKVKHNKKSLFLSIVVGTAVGFFQGIFGGGCNTYIIFSFVFIFGKSFLDAVACSKIPNFVFALISSLVFLFKGYINWGLALPLMLGMVLGSVFGVKLAIRKGSKFIRLLFVGLVILMAIKLLFF